MPSILDYANKNVNPQRAQEPAVEAARPQASSKRSIIDIARFNVFGSSQMQGKSPLNANVPTAGFKFKRGDVRNNIFQLLTVAESPDYVTLAGNKQDPELERMTVTQIAKKYGNRAAGKYQIQRDTALDTLRRAGLNPDTYVFDRKGQDRLFDLLLEQRGKLSDYKAGKIPKEQFARNIAHVWAGLPVDESGRSRYEDSGNKAHVKWIDVLRALE